LGHEIVDAGLASWKTILELIDSWEEMYKEKEKRVDVRAAEGADLESQ
jgi:hypothetical protein